ncbi:MAG: DUF4198 domain-containing protein [Deltaproteobacteria bacterium]|nr:DUF4198 domain-containing protein [Deltaproteobacteria bacterium]
MTKFIRPATIAMMLLLFTTFIPGISHAHNLWLNAVDYNPSFSERTGAHTKIYFGFGHKYPVQDFLEDDSLIEFKLIDEAGNAKDIEAEKGGFMATPVILKNPGANTVTAVTKSGFYTMYFKDGRVMHKMGSMEGLDNIILSLYYENYAKALVNVGETKEDSYSMPVGHKIEIISLENPYLKRVGEGLKIKVLYNGRPASFCDISATYVGFSSEEDYAFSNKTGSDGISEVRLLAPGQWIIRAVVRNQARESFKKDCLEEKYSATLTFGVK